MIDIKLNEDGCPDLAFVLAPDLRKGRTIVYLGGNIPQLNEGMLQNPDIYRIPEKIKEKVRTSNVPGCVILQEEIENILTHESCHITIYKITQNIRTTKAFDNIDNIDGRLFDSSELDPKGEGE